MKEFTPAPNSASIVSVTDRVKPVALGMVVTSVHFLGNRAAFVGGEENVAFVDAKGEITKVAVHSGGILSTASDGKRLVMGGDDGKVVSLDAKGEVTLLATDPKRRWIDAWRCIPTAPMAWSAGKTAFVKQRQGRGEVARGALDRRRSRLCAEGPAARDRALQRRDAVVSQHGRPSRISGMGRLASRRHLQPRQQIPGHHDA